MTTTDLTPKLQSLLTKRIANEADAVKFLHALIDAGLAYHPDDGARECLWAHSLSDDELTALDERMDDCFDFMAEPEIYDLLIDVC